MSIDLGNIDYYMENYFVDKHNSKEAKCLFLSLEDPEKYGKFPISINVVTDQCLNDIDFLKILINDDPDISPFMYDFIIDNIGEDGDTFKLANKIFKEKPMENFRKFLIGKKIKENNINENFLSEDFKCLANFTISNKKGSSPLSGQYLTIAPNKRVTLIRLEGYLNRGGKIPKQLIELNRKLFVFTPEADSVEYDSNLLYSVLDREGNRVIVTSRNIKNVTDSYDNCYALIRKEAILYVNNISIDDVDTLYNIINSEGSESIDDIKRLQVSVQAFDEYSKDISKIGETCKTKEEQLKVKVNTFLTSKAPDEVRAQIYTAYLTQDASIIDINKLNKSFITEQGYNDTTLVLLLASKYKVRQVSFDIVKKLLDKGYSIGNLKESLFKPTAPKDIILDWLIGKPIPIDYIKKQALTVPGLKDSINVDKSKDSNVVSIPQLCGVKIYIGFKMDNDKKKAMYIELNSFLSELKNKGINDLVLELNPILSIRDNTNCDLCGQTSCSFVFHLPDDGGVWNNVCDSCLRENYKNIGIGNIFINKRNYRELE